MCTIIMNLSHFADKTRDFIRKGAPLYCIEISCYEER
jgi:hypothetical protein